MAIIRKNPGLSGTVVALSLALGLFLLCWPPSPALADPPVYNPLAPEVADEIDLLRGQVGLDNTALACLNLSNEQLETLLAALRNQYDRQGSVWRDQRAAVVLKAAEVRQLQSAYLNGQGELNALNAARQELAQLKSTLAGYLASVRDTVAAGFSPSQLALLAHLHTRPDVAMPYRVLDLTPEQDAAATRATVRYRQRLAQAQDSHERQAIGADYDRELEAALGGGNLRLLDELRTYQAPASERVVAAIQKVLPRE